MIKAVENTPESHIARRIRQRMKVCAGILSEHRKVGLLFGFAYQARLKSQITGAHP